MAMSNGKHMLPVKLETRRAIEKQVGECESAPERADPPIKRSRHSGDALASTVGPKMLGEFTSREPVSRTIRMTSRGSAFNTRG